MSLVLMTGIGLNACAKNDTENTASQDAKGVEVTLTSPVITGMEEDVDLNAVTVYQNQEIVRAGFAGLIVKRYKNPGDRIRAGEALFLMRTKESSAADTVSIDIGGGRFSGFVRVYAHRPGIVKELDYQEGNAVAEGDKLGVIVDPRSLRIMMNVPYRYAKFVHRAATLVMHLPDGRRLRAQVLNSIPAIDPANQTQTYVLFPSPFAELPANLNIIVKLPVRKTDKAVALPKASILANETQTEFWAMQAINDTLAVRRNVIKGIETDSLVEIIQPVFHVHDRFIAGGAYGLPDTVKIIIHRQSD
ncbi:MAG: HlyD family efflux transporter periplasmic adaptor subunit [Acidobacteriota bacterium]